MLRQLRAAARSSRCCELRLDWLAGRKNLEQALRALPSALLQSRRHRKLTVIVTLRRRAAGGRFGGAQTEQIRYLLQAVAAGCDWCDLEIESAEKLSGGQQQQ